MKRYTLFTILAVLLVIAFLIDLAVGSATLSLSDIWSTLTGGETNPIYREIIFNYRLPKALTAILAGTALSLAGVLMQTLFHNPLAGPDVLVMTSGAGLDVMVRGELDEFGTYCEFFCRHSHALAKTAAFHKFRDWGNMPRNSR